MDIISLDKKTKVFFDIDNKIIGRVPTKSNLKKNGSDNSLYFGTYKNIIMNSILKAFFSYANITEFGKKVFEMKSYGQDLNVETNINNEGQLQIKVGKNGTMYSLFVSYQMSIEERVDSSDVIILVNFNENTIFFKKIEEVDIYGS